MTRRKARAVATVVGEKIGRLLPAEMAALRRLGGRQVRKLVKWARETRTDGPWIRQHVRREGPHRRPSTALRLLAGGGAKA